MPTESLIETLISEYQSGNTKPFLEFKDTWKVSTKLQLRHSWANVYTLSSPLWTDFVFNIRVIFNNNTSKTIEAVLIESPDDLKWRR